MFGNLPDNALEEYSGDIRKGDLITLKTGMMLVEPNGPVMVTQADNIKGLYEVMYTSSNYTVGVGRIDIESMFSECK